MTSAVADAPPEGRKHCPHCYSLMPDKAGFCLRCKKGEKEGESVEGLIKASVPLLGVAVGLISAITTLLTSYEQRRHSDTGRPEVLEWTQDGAKIIVSNSGARASVLSGTVTQLQTPKGAYVRCQTEESAAGNLKANPVKSNAKDPDKDDFECILKKSGMAGNQPIDKDIASLAVVLPSGQLESFVKIGHGPTPVELVFKENENPNQKFTFLNTTDDNDELHICYQKLEVRVMESDGRKNSFSYFRRCH